MTFPFRVLLVLLAVASPHPTRVQRAPQAPLSVVMDWLDPTPPPPSPEPLQVPFPARRTVQTEWPASLDPCGGDLPPCYVAQRESHGDYNAQNPTSTASGKWQFLDSTWANFEGYPRAALAPPGVQDEKARQLWNGGQGCGHWLAC